MLRLELNSLVTRVCWGGGGVEVSLEGGARLRAEVAVVALPLGVLKLGHGTMFRPPLPPAKTEAIRKLEFGLMDKIFLEFDSVFWDPDNPGIQLIMTDEEEGPKGEIRTAANTIHSRNDCGARCHRDQSGGKIK